MSDEQKTASEWFKEIAQQCVFVTEEEEDFWNNHEVVIPLIRRIHNATLERAAKVADERGFFNGAGEQAGEIIRALKEPV